ncbi:hypothetical protein BVX99_03200 [bacterium F16]|nr:hypothetical protein BVX99_03200 [bacterium F16]
MAVLGGTGLLAIAGISCASRMSPELGLVDGKLRPPPSTPNCVCSEFKDSKAFIAPFTFEGTPEEAWQQLKAAVLEEGGVIVEESRNYRWFTFTSRIFRFVDDVEFRLDSERRTIHVRSASRIGHSDLGVNRKRIESIRSRFLK